VQVPAAPGYRRITQYLDTQHPEYSMMIFIFNTPLVYELEVLGSLLEGDTLPRLAALQEKRGGVVPRFIGDNQGNTILGLAFYIHGDPQEAEENFWKFLDEVKRSPFSPEEIDSAVNKACSLPQVWNSSLEHQAEALSYLYGSGQPLQLLDDKVGLLRSITPEDVHVAANAYLTRENVTVVCALPIGTKPK
jgi:zinc protease